MNLRFSHLQSLLGKRVDSFDVVELIGDDPSTIERFEYQGAIEMKKAGVSVIFKEATWVVPATEFVDSKTLYVSAFHFHRESHDGYMAYSEQLPNDLKFGDSDVDVARKLGRPIACGGGGISSVLKAPIPHWLRYSLGDSILQLQLDADRKVEMASLYSPEVQSSGGVTAPTRLGRG